MSDASQNKCLDKAIIFLHIIKEKHLLKKCQSETFFVSFLKGFSLALFSYFMDKNIALHLLIFDFIHLWQWDWKLHLLEFKHLAMQSAFANICERMVSEALTTVL